MTSEVFAETATHLAHDLANGSVTAVQLCTELAERVQVLGHLNAFATFDPDQLLKQARQADADLKAGRIRGPLHGVPLIIKDNINTADLPTSGGTPALKGNRPAADAPIVARLREAGALIAGKANLHELSSGGTSANHTFGPVRNPYALTHVPGGSSGGTAAAISAGVVPAGLGTDTAGSVRVPAGLCGLFGFRPTVGRYSSDGIVPLSASLDTAGPLARSIDDIILLDRVLADLTPEVKERDVASIRLGVAIDLMARTAQDCVDVIEDCLTVLEQKGVTLVPLDLNPLRPLQTRASASVIDYEFAGAMTDYLTASAPHLTLAQLNAAIASPAVKSLNEDRLDAAFDEGAYQDAVGPGLVAFDRAWKELVQDHVVDAVAFPTTPHPALPLDQDDNVILDGESVFSWFYFQHTAMASIGRRPGIALPVGLTPAGLPVGLELDGLRGADEALLSTARAVASVLDPMPPPSL